jgi:hypothetical protein
LKKTKKQKETNLSTKYMGILQDVQLNFNIPRFITSVMFRTHWGTFLLNFPVSFWWILAILKADCDAALDGTAKKCSSIIKLLTNCFQALFRTWWSVILKRFQFIGALFHIHQWHPFTFYFFKDGL